MSQANNNIFTAPCAARGASVPCETAEVSSFLIGTEGPSDAGWPMMSEDITRFQSYKNRMRALLARSALRGTPKTGLSLRESHSIL